MIVATDRRELERADRAVAIGTFDGVHPGHRAVFEQAKATGLRSCVVTFDPHPRQVLGYAVQLLSSFERRLELIAESGVDETLVVEFTLDVARLTPEGFVQTMLEPLGTRVVVAGEDFRFGRERAGDLALLERLGLEVVPVPLVEGVSSSRIRDLLREGDVVAAARVLGRPHEIEGIVVSGDQRGGTLGYPTANLAVPETLLVPGYGIYSGAALDTRVAMSIGVNPHYGGEERRVEAFLLDFEGNLYGQKLRLELWERLRDERAFESEAALVEQIAYDVAQARASTRPG